MSHRLGGLIKGFRAFTSGWTDMKASSSSASAPTSTTDFHYSDAKGIWNAKSTTQFAKISPGGGITLVGQTSYNSSGNVSTTGAITTPAGAASGDMLVMVVHSGTGTPTITGWTTGHSATGANQNVHVHYLNLTSAPASSYTVSLSSTGTVNVSFFALRKTSGSITFGSATSAVDSSLTSVIFPTLTTSVPSLVIAVSAVRGSTTGTVVVPTLSTPYATISDISNGSSTLNSKMSMTEYAPFEAQSVNPATKTLPTSVSAVTSVLFSVS